jgi:opacity protein-like surface antigen
MNRLVMTLALMASAVPVFAQRNEIALLGGYTTSGDIDKKALGIQELAVKGSLTWGLAGGHDFSDRMGVEASWARQQSALSIGTSEGSAELFDMKLDVLQGSFVFLPGSRQSRIRPFFLASLGATILSANDLDSETKFSWAVGAGLKWFSSRRVGVRAQVRYAPTVLGDSSSDVCDPFGFCQSSLNQFEMLGGVVFRF